RTLEQAAQAVEREDRVIALGVIPRWAETGYGYLELEPQAAPDGVRRVRRFVEKPSTASAARFLPAGNYLWNAGIFVFRGSTLLGLLERLQPELARGLEAIAAAPDR